MSPGRRKVLGFVIAPMGTAVAAAIWMAVGLLFVPKMIPMLQVGASGPLLMAAGVTLLGAVMVGIVGVPTSIVFARRGITSLGPHLLVGCLAGLLAGAALVFAGASFADARLARMVSRYSTAGLGLGGATALVYWQIARPDVA